MQPVSTSFSSRNVRWIYLIAGAVLVFTFIPWLGETLFNTKGEPREAIVAVGMLDSGNWVLPRTCGGDFPYKPPMLAWLIAIFSWLFGGNVSEFTSRLPSALATIVMGIGTLRYFGRHSSWPVGIITAAITVTAFEVFRAATACRVDMVLTMFMVLTIYTLTWSKPRLAIWPVVLMTGAVMTKGPIGMVLPCLVAWLYFLFKREKFWQVTWRLALMGILSLILPALWYFAAAQQGGEEFIKLALEENVGRLTGTMSYESHVNPFYYNFITLFAGMAPYTLLAILAIFGKNHLKKHPLDQSELISIITIVAIVGFYCIPSSKRSVYLLPVYPFVSYFVTRMILWLEQNRPKPLKIYGCVMAVLAILLPVALVVVKYFLNIHLSDSAMVYVQGIKDWPFGPVTFLLLLVSVCVGVEALRELGRNAVVMIFATTFAIYWNLSATAFPAILNTKSDIVLAAEIKKTAPTGKVKTFIDDRLLRYYTAGFYSRDRLEPYHGEELPDNALMVVGEKDVKKFDELYGNRFQADTLVRMPRKSCDTRQKTLLLRLKNK